MMREMIIVLKANDTMTKKPYDGFESLRETVEGTISYFHSAVVQTILGKRLNFDMICNDEFAIDNDEKFDKVNALASVMSGQEIRGNVAVIVDLENGENRGFYDGSVYSECDDVMTVLQDFFDKHLEEIRKLHQIYDGCKTEPKFEIDVFD